MTKTPARPCGRGVKSKSIEAELLKLFIYSLHTNSICFVYIHTLYIHYIQKILLYTHVLAFLWISWRQHPLRGLEHRLSGPKRMDLKWFLEAIGRSSVYSCGAI